MREKPLIDATCTGAGARCIRHLPQRRLKLCMLLYLPEPENKYCCLCNREPGLCPFRVEAIRLPRGSQGSIWAYKNATRFGLIGGFDLHHRRRTEKLHETTTLKMWLVVSRAGLSLPRLEATQPSFSACASGPPTRLSVSASQASSARLVEPVGSSNRPLRQIRTPHEAALLFGGEGVRPGPVSAQFTAFH